MCETLRNRLLSIIRFIRSFVRGRVFVSLLIAETITPRLGRLSPQINSSKIFPFSLFDARKYRHRTASVYSRVLAHVMPPPLGNTFYEAIRKVDKDKYSMLQVSNPFSGEGEVVCGLI